MIAKNSLGRAAGANAIVASMAAAFGLAGMGQSFAGCGGYCEARQALAICHQAVEDQGLKTHERDAEFEKCKGDPAGYLQLEGLADEAGPTRE